MAVILFSWSLVLLCFIVLELLILRWSNKRTGWTKKRRSRTLVLTVCTSALLALQAGLVYDLHSYYQGEIYGPSWGESVDLLPGGTYQTKSLSNWYTVEYLDLQLRDWSGNVSLYIADENIPQNKYEQRDCSQYCRFIFRLPYLYSYAFVVANWTINLHNPSQSESIHGFIGIILYLADGPSLRQAILYHGWPLVAIPTLWVYTGVSILHERLRKPIDCVQVSEELQNGGSSTAQENPEQSQSSSGDAEDTKHG